MPNLGKAYVQIVPTTKDISSNIEKELNPGIENAKKSLSEKLGGGFKSAAKIGGIAIAGIFSSATAVLGSAMRTAIAEFANYEQLEGGVKKLFGEEDMQEVMQNAQNAFKTAGMSANEYMETVTSFSSSLIKSLDGDTQEAARLSDQAIRDMADNANTFGTDIEMIQNAYAGFARENYTMLDNLKLGYAGSKEGMQQLIDDANAIAKAQGKSADYTIESYADIVDAIHLVQENMNIAGTTEKEAMTTIQGALSATKSSWTNLLTAMAGGGDLDTALQGVVDSVMVTINLLAPKILETVPKIVEGLATLLTELAPQLGQMITDLFPTLMQAAVSIAGSLLQQLPSVIGTVVSTLWDTAKKLFKSVNWGEIGQNLINGIKDGILNAVSWLIDSVKSTCSKLVNSVKDFFGIASPSKLMYEFGEYIDLGLANGISDNVSEVTSAMNRLNTEAYGGFTANVNHTGNVSGFNQTVNIYSPRELSPSENARLIRNNTRQMVLNLRGV